MTTRMRSSQAGQTIVYCLHQSIGHLGIFVSGKVATKEHGEFAQSMDMIDLMPPGLYEAVITGVDDTVEHPELVQGNYLFSLETRTLEDVRALGGDARRRPARLPQRRECRKSTGGLYRTFLRPGSANGGDRAKRRGAADCTLTGCGSGCSRTKTR